jgi:predicted transcriptional regulator
MYVANLSFALNNCLRETVDAGFLDLNGSTYTITEKGEEFLVEYYRYRSGH